jgi:hypothetical protein
VGPQDPYWLHHPTSWDGLGICSASPVENLQAVQLNLRTKMEDDQTPTVGIPAAYVFPKREIH